MGLVTIVLLIEAAETFWWTQSGSISTGDCAIKGNISQLTGEGINHIPGGGYYAETIIDQSAGERWFCSEAEARAAGWRTSKR